MIRVSAHGRLHFGLIHPGPATNWQDCDGAATVSGRRFGGCGVMVQQPSVQIRIEDAASWSAVGPAADRALQFATRFAESVPGELNPQRITVEQMLPEHCGLGSGTQLAMAVARALAMAAGHPDWGAVELATRVSRGERSAIGVHGFQHGGFIVDGGRGDDHGIAPLIAHVPVSKEWRWLLFWPAEATGMHGSAEREAFDNLQWTDRTQRHADAMCRLLVMGMLPAATAGDFSSFSGALHDYNARAGEIMSSHQGGRHSAPFARQMIAAIRCQGIIGAGQSSWGPLVFALLRNTDEAEDIRRRMQTDGVHAQITATSHGL